MKYLEELKNYIRDQFLDPQTAGWPNGMSQSGNCASPVGSQLMISGKTDEERSLVRVTWWMQH